MYEVQVGSKVGKILGAIIVSSLAYSTWGNGMAGFSGEALGHSGAKTCRTSCVP